MARPSTDAVLEVLRDRYGRTFAREAGITLQDTPSPLFRLLCLSILVSARISSDIALAATRALAAAGWTTVEKMASSSWEERTTVLNEAGYARYDESTARMLGDTAELVLARWHGDLREMREEAERDPDRIHALVQEAKGIGAVGADVFCREAQHVWSELRPFADDRVLGPAERLGLGGSPEGLAEHAGTDDLSEVAAAIVRAELDHAIDDVLAAAAG
ncbi:MAG TPA: hypothetical protein VK866_09940 [Acidimicrobiales bacterium]|nr:hypothetical protein [Acidimicrobiales bacterium]